MTHAVRERLFVLLATVAIISCAGSAGPSRPATTGGAGGSGGPAPSGGAGGAGGSTIVLDAADSTDSDLPPLADAQGPRFIVDAPVLPPSAPDVAMINNKACEYLKMGPYAMVTPQGQYSYSAPPIATDPTAFRVPIVGRQYGHVTFNPTAAGNFLFFTSVSVPITIFSLAGEVIDPKALETRIPECMEVKARHTYPLKKESFVIRFGPANIPSVDVVVATGLP
jgi:hypothetical protein